MRAVNVLQIVVGGKNFNGIVSFIYQFYKHIDQKRVHFDFLVVRENAFELKMDDPVFADSQFYVLNAVKKNKKTDHLKMMQGLEKVLAEHAYDVVHINTLTVGAQAPLIHVCKKQKVPVVISHSHNEYAKTISSVKLLAHKVFQPYINNNSDYLFACSKKAGECLFGEEGTKSEKFRLINNAVDAGKFSYSDETRDRVRAAFQVSPETAVIGQVGRLSTQKNQSFALDVFSAYLKKNPNACFWIVGQGEDQEMLVQKAADLGISDSVDFLGQRSDVSDLLNAMDVLLFPSLWEGLSVAAIEAQSTGIRILASDDLTPETAITDLVAFLPLSAGADAWSEALESMMRKPEKRTDRYEDLRKAGFTIQEEAKRLEDFYCEVSKESIEA